MPVYTFVKADGGSSSTMSSSKYELTGNVTSGNVLRIKDMGFAAEPTFVPIFGMPNKLELNTEVRSEVYKLSPINIQTKIMNYDDGKLILYLGLQSQDENVHTVNISSNSPKLYQFLKTTQDNEWHWHVIYNDNAVADINSWKFDLEVALVTDNVNPMLNSVFEDDNTTDVELIGVDGSVRAHGCIMAAASPFFRAAFYGDFAEARDKRLTISDANVAALKLIKQYAYTGIVHPEPAMLVTLIQLASRFMMPSLARACAAMLSDLPPDELVQLINLKPTLMEEKEKPQPPKPVFGNTSEALNDIPKTRQYINSKTGAGDYISTQKRKKTGN